VASFEKVEVVKKMPLFTPCSFLPIQLGLYFYYRSTGFIGGIIE